jgi:UPF0271 protein
MTTMDINCDMGEYPEAIAGGTQDSLMAYVTSVNIACGAHAGDEQTMRATVEQAIRHSVAIGAHPGYPDRENFGRFEMDMPVAELSDSIYRQIAALDAIVRRCGARLAHVKPHGALYNQAARNRTLARAISEAVARISPQLVVLGLAGSPMLDEFRNANLTAAAEAFADRRYEAGGHLRSRKFADALIRDPEAAADQALSIAVRNSVTAVDGTEVPLRADTICIHGDTPGAPAIAAAVVRRLRDNNVLLRALRGKTGRH